MSTKAMITLDNIGGGAASEMFADSLKKVIENIVNPNTKPDATRTITLKMKVKPDKKQRTLCTVELSCVESLAASLPFETAMFVGVGDEGAEASEYAPQQSTLFDQGEGEQQRKRNVVAIAGGR